MSATAYYTAAREILFENAYEAKIRNKLYKRVLPSREFYVHQWNWDSATHAMALVHIDEEWAYEEIYSLLCGQWKNGLVPHIVFNPLEKTYFPGPEFWDAKSASQINCFTSGITQPPLLAVSAAYVYKKAKNRKSADRFLNTVLPKLIAYHNHLKYYRDPEDSGLISIIHPWESGTDNSPRWDDVLDKINIEAIPDYVKRIVDMHRTDLKGDNNSHRPQVNDYYRYIYLIEMYKSWKWSFPKIISNSPFVVKDILVNSIWCRANEALAKLVEFKNKSESSKYRNWARQTREAIKGSWNKNLQLFEGYHVLSRRKIPLREHTIANFLPFYAKAVKTEQLPFLLSQLYNPKKYFSSIPFPSTPLDNPKFDSYRYWRGPTWPITNLLIIEGLNNYKDDNLCLVLRDLLIDKTVQMIENHGFFEYYDPLFGKSKNSQRALGFGSFSWSAAVYIYLTKEYKSKHKKDA